MRTTRKILAYEAVGFVAVIGLLWADEILDLPYRLLGAPRTPVNFGEGILESLLVAALAIVVLLLTRLLLDRVRHLEGLMHVCGACGKVRDRDGWVSVEQYLEAHSEAELRRSYCVDCMLQQLGYSPRSGTRPGSAPEDPAS